MKKTITLLAGLIVWGFVNSAAAVNFVEVKSGESPSEMDYRISHGTSLDSDVVVFKKNGKPLLPDLEKQKKQQPANELSFTFDSPEYPWTVEELATLQQLIADFYPVIKKIYGNPAFLITVNIRKNPTITLAGLYYPSGNEIVVHDLNTIDPVIHEMIHAFRDDLVISSNAYEEGMTRAAEIAAFGELPQYPYWDRNHSYDIDVYYDLNNEPGIASSSGNFFMGFPNPLMKYQQAGYAWGKLLIEEDAFLAKFNALYYPLGYADPAIAGSTPTLRTMAAKLKHRVEGEPFSAWYDRQHIFDENPGMGYQTLYKGDVDILYLFSRDPDGTVHRLPGVDVEWEIYSCGGALLRTGMDQTTEYGWVDFRLWELSSQYQGKVRIEARHFLPDTIITRQVFASTAQRSGIFGIADVCEGEIDLVRVSGTNVRNVAIRNGAFVIPELSSIAGKFVLKQNGGAERTVTKDASDYFVMFGTSAGE